MKSARSAKYVATVILLATVGINLACCSDEDDGRNVPSALSSNLAKETSLHLTVEAKQLFAEDVFEKLRKGEVLSSRAFLMLSYFYFGNLAVVDTIIPFAFEAPENNDGTSLAASKALAAAGMKDVFVVHQAIVLRGIGETKSESLNSLGLLSLLLSEVTSQTAPTTSELIKMPSLDRVASAKAVMNKFMENFEAISQHYISERESAMKNIDQEIIEMKKHAPK